MIKKEQCMRYNASYDLQQFNQDMFSDISVGELKDATLFLSEKYTTTWKYTPENLETYQ